MKKLIILMLMVLCVSACDYLPVSGGALEGTPAEVPADLSALGAPDIIQLETNGESGPYSVNLWIVLVDGALHVFAGDNRTTWVENIERDANVRLGVNGSIYALSAVQVQDADVFERFAQAWDAKYGNRPRNENVDETYLFRLQ